MRSAAITSNPNTINTDTGEDGGGDRWRHVKALAGAVPGVLNGLKTKVQQKALDSRKLINGWLVEIKFNCFYF
jgi:hypothetical protein